MASDAFIPPLTQSDSDGNSGLVVTSNALLHGQLVQLETASRQCLYAIFLVMLATLCTSVSLSAMYKESSVVQVSLPSQLCMGDSDTHCIRIQNSELVWSGSFEHDRAEYSTFRLVMDPKRLKEAPELDMTFNANVTLSVPDPDADGAWVSNEREMIGTIRCSKVSDRCEEITLVSPLWSSVMLSNDPRIVLSVTLFVEPSFLDQYSIEFNVSKPSGDYVAMSQFASGLYAYAVAATAAWFWFVSWKHEGSHRWLPERKWVLTILCCEVFMLNPLNCFIAGESQSDWKLVKRIFFQVGKLICVLLVTPNIIPSDLSISKCIFVVMFKGLRRKDIFPGWKFYRGAVITTVILSTVTIANAITDRFQLTSDVAAETVAQRLSQRTFNAGGSVYESVIGYQLITLLLEWSFSSGVLSALPYLSKRYSHLTNQFLKVVVALMPLNIIICSAMGVAPFEDDQTIPTNLEQGQSIATSTLYVVCSFLIAFAYAPPYQNEAHLKKKGGDTNDKLSALLEKDSRLDLECVAKVFHVAAEAYKPYPPTGVTVLTISDGWSDKDNAPPSSPAEPLASNRDRGLPSETGAVAQSQKDEAIAAIAAAEIGDVDEDEALEREDPLTTPLENCEDGDSFLLRSCTGSDTVDLRGNDFSCVEMVKNERTDLQFIVARSANHVVFAFRGTVSTTNMKTDIRIMQTTWEEEAWECNPASGLGNVISAAVSTRVHSGFLAAYHSLRKTVHECVERHVSQEDRLILAGHSLGGALATLASYDISMSFPGKKVEMYTFGSPRVGNLSFAASFLTKVPHCFRIVHDGDAITGGPRPFYKHVGIPVIIDQYGNIQVNPSFVETVFMTKSRTSLNRHSRNAYRMSLASLLGIGGHMGVPQGFVPPELVKGPTSEVRSCWEKYGFLLYCFLYVMAINCFVFAGYAATAYNLLEMEVQGNARVVNNADVDKQFDFTNELRSHVYYATIIGGSVIALIAFILYLRDMRVRRTRLLQRTAAGQSYGEIVN